MIEVNAFKTLIDEQEERLPLLTLDEFFEGNTMEDSIAPNDCGFGRPSLAEIWDMLKKIEARPDIAWIRVSLYDETEIMECDGKEELVLCGESIVVCTSLQASELEELVNCDWLCSGGAEEWEVSSIDSLFSRRPPVPDGFQCLEIVWD